MTLCIAEKRGGLVRFVSDSRISIGDNSIDFGVKIFKLPVIIRSATCSETKRSELLYSHTLGICVIGSTLNSYLVKETVFEILQNLQYAGFTADFSMESFCTIIAKVYEKFSRDICSILDKNGIAQLVVGGYCPQSKTIRTFHFALNDTAYPITATVTEILKESGIEFFGSGTSAARQINSSKSVDSFHILRSVIHDPSVTSVGGPVQTGVFEGPEFTIKGVQDYVLTDLGMFEYRHSLRGVNLYQDEFEQFGLSFHVSYEFLAPFHNDMKRLFAERFKTSAALHRSEEVRVSEEERDI